MEVALKNFILSFDTSSTRAPYWKFLWIYNNIHIYAQIIPVLSHLSWALWKIKWKKKYWFTKIKRTESKRKTFDNDGWKEEILRKLMMENLWINLFSITFFKGSAEDVSVELFLVKLSNNFTTAVFPLYIFISVLPIDENQKLTIHILGTYLKVLVFLN